MEKLLNEITKILKNSISFSLSNHFRDSLRYIEEYIKLRSNLSDQESQDILDKILFRRIDECFVGAEQSYKDYSFFLDQEWKNFEHKANELVYCVQDSYLLDKIETWILEGYAYKDICSANEGDIVIDGGAFTGNTALFFSEKVGCSGKVYAFEASPNTYDKLKKGIEICRDNNISAYNMALGDCEDLISFSGDGPGSKIVKDQGKYNNIKLISIDKFVEKENIKKIDFIKMDIEGYEEKALDGSKNAILNFHPKLAICIYHKDKDIFDIWKKIVSIREDYDFYIKHNSKKAHETVLFANPNKEAYIKKIEKKEFTTISSLLESIFVSQYSLFSQLIFSNIKNHLQKKLNIETLPFLKVSDLCYYIPFSDDWRLHYEFLVAGKNMKIVIHFESLNKDINKKLFHLFEERSSHIQNGIPYLLTYSQINKYECGFSIPIKKGDQSLLFASIMEKFIKNSIPILAKAEILNENFSLNYLNNKFSL